MESYPSKLVENVVYEMSKLPGIGKKTALRLALYLLKEDENYSEMLGNSIIKMRQEIMFCTNCHNISDRETCDICNNPNRDHSTICVVQDVRDVMAIEKTVQYKGVYHILNGIISPMDGIGPQDLTIESLVGKIAQGTVKEVIMALPTTVEGDTTNFYIFKRLKDFQIQITTLARGVAIGDDLEFTDEVTLGRSILNRTPYESGLKGNY